MEWTRAEARDTNIEFLGKISFNVIKEEVKSMDENELSSLAKECILELTKDLRAECLKTDFVNKLNIRDKFMEPEPWVIESHAEC